MLKLPLIGCLLLTAASAHAALTVQAYWRMGEDDAGAAAGNMVNVLATDQEGFADLSRNGSPFYSADVAVTANTATGSTLSVSFDGQAYYSAPVTAGVTDNFVVEAWFNASSLTGNSFIFYNGQSNSSGFGLYRSGDSINAIYGGVTLIDAGYTITQDTWYYVALVRDGGNTSLYLNDNVSLLLTTASPVFPTGNLAVGNNGFNVTENWLGLLDEVRLSTFAAGTFDEGDLLYSAVPENSQLALLLGAVTLSLMAWRRRSVAR